jgi:hypothetical protein
LGRKVVAIRERLEVVLGEEVLVFRIGLGVRRPWWQLEMWAGKEGMGWARVVDRAGMLGACPSRKACALWREFKPWRGSCCMT